MDSGLAAFSPAPGMTARLTCLDRIVKSAKLSLRYFPGFLGANPGQLCERRHAPAHDSVRFAGRCGLRGCRGAVYGYLLARTVPDTAHACGVTAVAAAYWNIDRAGADCDRVDGDSRRARGASAAQSVRQAAKSAVAAP